MIFKRIAENTCALVGCDATETHLEVPQKVDIYGEVCIVIAVDKRAFEGNSSLVSVKLPPIHEIEWRAFAECESLKSVEIECLYGDIFDSAFISCSNLEYVKIRLLQSANIHSDAFSFCSKLKNVELRFPKNWNVQTAFDFAKISGNAFWDTPFFKSLRRADDSYVLENRLLKYIGHNAEYILTNEIQIIENGAFARNMFLLNVILNEQLRIIEKYAFIGCKIEEIYVPKNVKLICEKAFSESHLKRVSIHKSTLFYSNSFPVGTEIEWRE